MAHFHLLFDNVRTTCTPTTPNTGPDLDNLSNQMAPPSRPASSHPGHLHPELQVHIPLSFFFLNSIISSMNIPEKHIFIAFHVVRKGMVLYVIFWSTCSFYLAFIIAKIHLHHCTSPQVIHFNSCLIFHCVATSQRIHPYSCTDGHLGCFQVSAAGNRIAMNVLVQVSQSPHARDSFGYTPRCKMSGTPGYTDAELLAFMPDCFPKSLHQSALSSSV